MTNAAKIDSLKQTNPILSKRLPIMSVFTGVIDQRLDSIINSNNAVI
ncbi:hypothetical protein SHLI107390_03970 [Shewanella livingstonensis]